MQIRFYRSSDREALQSYHLTDLRFTSHPSQAVADLENRYAILGLEEHQIVTFLILDAGEKKLLMAVSQIACSFVAFQRMKTFGCEGTVVRR